MPYPENFVVRLIICIVGMVAIWNLVFFLMDTFLWHQTFQFDVVLGLIVPVVVGVIEAYTWKPKEETK